MTGAEQLMALARAQNVDPEVAPCWSLLLEGLAKEWIAPHNLALYIAAVEKRDIIGVNELTIEKSHDDPSRVEVTFVDQVESCPADKLATELKRLMRGYLGLPRDVPSKPALSDREDPAGAIRLLAQLFELAPQEIVGDLAAYRHRWRDLLRREVQIARAVRSRNPQELESAKVAAASLRDELKKQGIPGLDTLPIGKPELLRPLLRSLEKQSAESAAYAVQLLLRAIDDPSVDVRWLLDSLEKSPLLQSGEH